MIFFSRIIVLLHDLILKDKSNLWNLSHSNLSDVQKLFSHKYFFPIGHSHFIFSSEWKFSSPMLKIFIRVQSLLFKQKSSIFKLSLQFSTDFIKLFNFFIPSRFSLFFFAENAFFLKVKNKLAFTNYHIVKIILQIAHCRYILNVIKNLTNSFSGCT